MKQADLGLNPSTKRTRKREFLAEQMLKAINELLCDKGLMLRAGTVVDATLISAPSSTKNALGERKRPAGTRKCVLQRDRSLH